LPRCAWSSSAARLLRVAAVRIAVAMGYRADLVDGEARAGDFAGTVRVLPRLGPEAIEPGAHVLVATMDESDLEALEAALRLHPAYVGVIASRKRFGELRDALSARGIAARCWTPSSRPRASISALVRPKRSR